MRAHLLGLLQQAEISPTHELESDKVEEFTKCVLGIYNGIVCRPESVTRAQVESFHKCVPFLEYW